MTKKVDELIEEVFEKYDSGEQMGRDVLKYLLRKAIERNMVFKNEGDEQCTT